MLIPFKIKRSSLGHATKAPTTTAHAQSAKYSESGAKITACAERKRGKLLEMEDSGECCVIVSTKNGVEKGNRPDFQKKHWRSFTYFLPLVDPAPQVSTHIQAVPSPPPPNAERRNKEETPSFEDRGGVQDNSKLKQGDTMLVTCVPKHAWLPYIIDNLCLHVNHFSTRIDNSGEECVMGHYS